VASDQALDLELERAMDGIRRLASLGRSAREAGNRKVRQPLATMRVAVPRGVDNSQFHELLPLLRQEVNVKAIEIVASDADLVRLRAKANFRSLGKRFGKETPEVAKAVATLAAPDLRALEDGHPVTMAFGGAAVEILPEDVVVERLVTSDWLVQSAATFVVALDPDLTPELRAEGLAREVVSRVQRLRKDAGYEYTTRIELGVTGDADVLAAVDAHRDFIQGETLARGITAGQVLDRADGREQAPIDEHPVTLSVRRWTD